MNLKSPSSHLAEALVRAETWPHGEAGEGAGAPAGAFTVAVSREAGARGTSVARAVGARLGWPVYDQELLDAIAKDLKVGVGLLEGVDEKPASWLRESVEAFASVPTVTEAAYFRRLLQTLLALGARGECLIVGRGAVHLLPQATTLRVRLTARLEDRIAVMSRELGVSPHEAARHVDKSDRERARFIKDHFQKDPSDPQHYDLVLNSSRFSVEECGQLIIEALRRLQARSAGAAATAPVA